MLRSFIPFVLASLGFIMLSWADRMPLFEWQISETASDSSSPCDFKLPSSPWMTRWGESLDLRGRPYHLEKLNVVIRRSRNDEVLDQVSLVLYNNTSWLSVWSVIEIGLSISYMWWFLLQGKQDRAFHLVMAVFLTGIAVLMHLLLAQAHTVSLAGPAVGWARYFGKDCPGTITFSARLLKIYYETPATFFTGVLIELGALGMMLRQMVKIAKESAKSAVG